MSSRLIHQSRTVQIVRNVDNTSKLTWNEPLLIPYLVDEIRVTSCVATPTSDFVEAHNTTTNSQTLNIYCNDLFGGCGTYVGSAPLCTKSRAMADDFRTIAANNTPAANSCQSRYVFPPSAKRNVNGSYTFQITNSNRGSLVVGNADETEIPQFHLSIVMEFIQYSEREQSVEDDLQSDFMTLVKSGRRRL